MEYTWLLLEIILINMVLSGDNAVVIAMASKNLPKAQRRRAIWWGAFAAVMLRIALTGVAVIILGIPLIQALGAMLLMYIALKLVSDDHGTEQVREAATLASAIWTIMIADFVMSLDNVLAIAAIAQGDFKLLIFGIGISIPLIIWGSTVIMKLLDRLPILNIVGAAILGYTAGEMLIRDKKIAQWLGNVHESYHWAIPLLCILLVLVGGYLFKRSSTRMS